MSMMSAPAIIKISMFNPPSHSTRNRLNASADFRRSKESAGVNQQGFKKTGLAKGITKNVGILGITSFFTDISSEMLYPVIPIFLTSVLGAPMSIVGLIEGVAESTASILKGVSGWLSDRFRKRLPFVVGGYTLSALAKPVLYLAYAWPVVLFSRFLDRMGKGLRASARDAMIADSTQVPYRGKAFGFHRAMDTLGACIGPLFAIWFLSGLKENIRVVFLIAFVPALLGVLTLIFFLKEPPVNFPATLPFMLRAGSRQRRDKIFTPRFKLFLVATAVFSIGNSSDAFLIIRSKGLGLSLTMVILAYVLYNISYSILSTPFGALSDKISRRLIMIAGYVIFTVVYVGFGLARSSGMVWALFPVYGFYIAMTDGVGKALVSDMVEPGHVATALGFYHFVLGIFALFASVIAGLLWTHIGVQAPFLYGAAMSLIACVILSLIG